MKLFKAVKVFSREEEAQERKKNEWTNGSYLLRILLKFKRSRNLIIVSKRFTI